MSLLPISEAISVQFPMIRHATEIGWVPITPEDALRKRGGETGMLFRNEIETRIGAFNSWMSADAIRRVIEQLEAVQPNIEGNREMLSWLRGERQEYDEAEQRHRRVRFVDFETPIVEKRKIISALQEGERFYSRMLGCLMKYVLSKVPSANAEEVIVITDTIPLNKRRHNIEKNVQLALAKVLSPSMKYHILHHDSRSHHGLQMADYCCWAVYRKWGSCSTSGIVTLAADLVDQQPGFQDFVIAHELLHLRVPNHGKLFKAFMTAHVPDWKSHDIRRCHA